MERLLFPHIALAFNSLKSLSNFTADSIGLLSPWSMIASAEVTSSSLWSEKEAIMAVIVSSGDTMTSTVSRCDVLEVFKL